MAIEPPDEAKNFAALMRMLDIALREIGECDSMRFCTVVWCDCSEGVLFSGSSDQNIKRTVDMLRMNADQLEQSGADLPVMGNA